MKSHSFRTYAFISYSHRDMGVAKWMQRRLEGFRLPTEVHNDIEAQNRYLRPIFRDQSDLNTGILSDELRKHLEESKFLILICSKNSAQSAWVSDEAKAFVEMGRLDRIIPVIIPDGDTSEIDLFPQFLRQYFEQHPEKELFGINIGEVGKEKALIRVISKMLDVSFDSLWQRHQRQKRIKILTATIISFIAILALYLFAIPVAVSIDVKMQKANLPIGDKVALTVDGGDYFSSPENPQFEKITIPGYKLFSKLNIALVSQFYSPVDTVVDVGFGMDREVNLKLNRDDAFAIYAGTVYDSEMNPLPDVTVSVADFSSVTDMEGNFSIKLPLEMQRQELPIRLQKTGWQPIEREDETPGRSLKFIMHEE